MNFRSQVLYLTILFCVPTMAIAQGAEGANPAKGEQTGNEAKEKNAEKKKPSAQGEKMTLVDTLDEKVPLEVGVQLRIFKQARERQLQLEKQKSQLERRRLRLGQMLKEVESRYQNLRVIQDELTQKVNNDKDSNLAETKASREKKKADRVAQVIRLSKVFNKMKADEAAKMIPVMDEELAIDVVARLKPKQAASILGKLEAELAAKLTMKMAERKRN